MTNPIVRRVQRHIDGERNKGGMTVGMPKISIHSSDAEYLCRAAESLAARDEQIKVLRERLKRTYLTLHRVALALRGPDPGLSDRLYGTMKAILHDLGLDDPEALALTEPSAEPEDEYRLTSADDAQHQVPVSAEDEAAFDEAVSSAEPEGWRSMKSAPEDGSWVRCRGDQPGNKNSEFDAHFAQTILLCRAWMNRRGQLVTPREWKPKSPADAEEE